MPRGLTRPRLGLAHSRARRNCESRSGWIVGESGTRGGGSAGSGRARRSGCASSRDFPRPGQRSTHRGTRKRRKRIGGRFSPTGGSLHPRHRSRLRWQENHRLGWAQGHPPPGGLRRRRHEPWRRQHAPRRCLRARRRHPCARRSPRARWRRVEARWRPRRPRPRRQRGPRGRGSGTSPP
jgi:hypothetical protein